VKRENGTLDKNTRKHIINKKKKGQRRHYEMAHDQTSLKVLLLLVSK